MSNDRSDLTQREKLIQAAGVLFHAAPRETRQALAEAFWAYEHDPGMTTGRAMAELGRAIACCIEFEL